MDTSEPIRTEEESELTIGARRELAGEIFQRLVGIKVICAGCGNRVNQNYCYRCFDCDCWFCKDCAGIHFGRTTCT